MINNEINLRLTLILCHNLEIAFFSHIFFNVAVSLINALPRAVTSKVVVHDTNNEDRPIMVLG